MSWLGVTGEQVSACQIEFEQSSEWRSRYFWGGRSRLSRSPAIRHYEDNQAGDNLYQAVMAAQASAGDWTRDWGSRCARVNSGSDADKRDQHERVSQHPNQRPSSFEQIVPDVEPAFLVSGVHRGEAPAVRRMSISDSQTN